nr:phasin family protein [Allorhizocola rhizosphaerae]
MQDALKAYLELALGLGEASKKKAEKTVKKLAKELTGKGQATAGQLQGMAEDLIATSAANREAISRLVRVEMDRALSRVGLATADDVSSLVARIDALERQLRDGQAAATAGGPAAAKAPAGGTAAKATTRKASPGTPQIKAPVVTKAPSKKVAEVPVAKKVAKKAVNKTTAKKAVPTTEATP